MNHSAYSSQGAAEGADSIQCKRVHFDTRINPMTRTIPELLAMHGVGHDCRNFERPVGGAPVTSVGETGKVSVLRRLELPHKWIGVCKDQTRITGAQEGIACRGASLKWVCQER